jgi:sugar phosphate isomerase/epimerase
MIDLSSRRDFMRLALTMLPASAAFAKAIDSKVKGVQFGVQSYSFRDLNLGDAIQGMVADGLGDCELFSPHIEAGGIQAMQEVMKAFEGKERPSSEQIKEAFASYGKKVKAWRLSVPLDYFVDIKKKFDDAGIHLYAYNLSFNDQFSDEEIDRGFLMAKALGVKIITVSTTLPVAQRVAPFADKHKVMVAMHGHSDLKDPTQFATPESFEKALAMSKWFRINLDIGHFTAAGFDSVDFIQKHHDNIVLLHLKDREKNEGENVPWGTGDTPIKEVLLLLKKHRYPIPAFIEYEYKGAGSSQEEVAKCYSYCKEVLA